MKKYLPPIIKLDLAKNIVSPMPGSIISVSVEPGQKVVDG
jgi:biotin carboxyl carrier protein